MLFSTGVIVDFQFAVGGIDHQFIPSFNAIIQSFADRTWATLSYILRPSTRPGPLRLVDPRFKRCERKCGNRSKHS
jgi:hypothetical protein